MADAHAQNQEDAGLQLANLARLVVRTLRLVQRLREELEQAKEVTRVAVGEIADRDRALDCSRAQIKNLRLEVRAIMSGRTIGQQRQAEESGEPAIGQDVSA